MIEGRNYTSRKVSGKSFGTIAQNMTNPPTRRHSGPRAEDNWGMRENQQNFITLRFSTFQREGRVQTIKISHPHSQAVPPEKSITVGGRERLIITKTEIRIITKSHYPHHPSAEFHAILFPKPLRGEGNSKVFTPLFPPRTYSLSTKFDNLSCFHGNEFSKSCP
ncbi:hypothetical protein CDAR_16711 [Caerostris darwini]|uniref:Uncharacterized protein n=1 Tax=Caerostris darwini TaxID=1538125 RepID=A0AAV4ULF1_9ARAC|nr:hypothetical protein CDAR_16711 [Caerostris darwini]